jgi:sugar transferase (PEP-CTERM/EpsH1 system associated)
LKSYGAALASDWFPNGVDSEYFAPQGSDYDPDTIAFVGRMDYYPNQQCMFDFCRETLPLLKRHRPQVKLLIVGADPSPQVRRLGDIEGVKVTGSVPDVRPFVRGAALTVAPLAIARGTQNKILEAMAMGVPVVTSSAAAGGVDAVAGEHLLVADSPPAQCEAIASLLVDRERRGHFARAGRARMLSHHAWPQSMQRLDTIIARCLAAFTVESSSQAATS